MAVQLAKRRRERETLGLGDQHATAATVKKSALPFREKMGEADIDAQTLEVTEVKPGMHEDSEGITVRPIYRISWRRQPLRLPGVLTLPLGNGSSGRFVRISLQRINVPPEARRRLEIAQSLAELDESAVFLSTQLADSHLNLVLAVRIQDQWLEVYRWSSSWTKLGISRLDICGF